MRLNSYQTRDDAEIDLIVERPGMPTALIEIKSSTNIRESDVASLSKLRLDFNKSEAFCF